MDYETRRIVEGELRSGERLLWHGQPQQGLRLTAMHLRVLVEENPLIQDSRRPGGDKIWVGVFDDTVVLNTNRHPVGREELRVGRRVSVAAPFVLQSDPGQADADTIVVD